MSNIDLTKKLIKMENNSKIGPELLSDLGDIILKLNEINFDISLLTAKEKQSICLLQNYWCHKHYLSVLKKQEKQEKSISRQNSRITNSSHIKNNLYDNCMNLILVISSKISNDDYCAEQMVNNFINHLSYHQGCFNYIISFFRLFSNSNSIKVAAKKKNLVNYLFEFYKYLYMSCYFLEFVDKEALEEFFYTEEEIDEVILKENYDSDNHMGRENKSIDDNINSNYYENSNVRDAKEKNVKFGSNIVIDNSNSNTANNPNINSNSNNNNNNINVSLNTNKPNSNVINAFRSSPQVNIKSKIKIPNLKLPSNNTNNTNSILLENILNSKSINNQSESEKHRFQINYNNSKGNNLNSLNSINIVNNNINSNNLITNINSAIFNNNQDSVSERVTKQRHFMNKKNNEFAVSEKLGSIAFQMGESLLTSSLGEVLSIKREEESNDKFYNKKTIIEKFFSNVSHIKTNVDSSQYNINTIDKDYLLSLKNNNFEFDFSIRKRKRTESANLNALSNQRKNTKLDNWYNYYNNSNNDDSGNRLSLSRKVVDAGLNVSNFIISNRIESLSPFTNNNTKNNYFNSSFNFKFDNMLNNTQRIISNHSNINSENTHLNEYKSLFNINQKNYYFNSIIESFFNIKEQQSKYILELNDFLKSNTNNTNTSNTNTNIKLLIIAFREKFISNLLSSLTSKSSHFYKSCYKLREVLSNFILKCLKDYNINDDDDIQKVNFNIQTLTSFLFLPSSEFHYNKLKLKCFEIKESFFNQCKSFKYFSKKPEVSFINNSLIMKNLKSSNSNHNSNNNNNSSSSYNRSFNNFNLSISPYDCEIMNLNNIGSVYLDIVYFLSNLKYYDSDFEFDFNNNKENISSNKNTNTNNPENEQFKKIGLFESSNSLAFNMLKYSNMNLPLLNFNNNNTNNKNSINNSTNLKSHKQIKQEILYNNATNNSYFNNFNSNINSKESFIYNNLQYSYKLNYNKEFFSGLSITIPQPLNKKTVHINNVKDIDNINTNPLSIQTPMEKDSGTNFHTIGGMLEEDSQVKSSLDLVSEFEAVFQIIDIISYCGKKSTKEIVKKNIVFCSLDNKEGEYFKSFISNYNNNSNSKCNNNSNNNTLHYINKTILNGSNNTAYDINYFTNLNSIKKDLYYSSNSYIQILLTRISFIILTKDFIKNILILKSLSHSIKLLIESLEKAKDSVLVSFIFHNYFEIFLLIKESLLEFMITDIGCLCINSSDDTTWRNTVRNTSIIQQNFYMSGYNNSTNLYNDSLPNSLVRKSSNNAEENNYNPIHQIQRSKKTKSENFSNFNISNRNTQNNNNNNNTNNNVNNIHSINTLNNNNQIEKEKVRTKSSTNANTNIQNNNNNKNNIHFSIPISSNTTNNNNYSNSNNMNNNINTNNSNNKSNSPNKINMSYYNNNTNNKHSISKKTLMDLNKTKLLNNNTEYTELLVNYVYLISLFSFYHENSYYANSSANDNKDFFGFSYRAKDAFFKYEFNHNEVSISKLLNISFLDCYLFNDMVLSVVFYLLNYKNLFEVIKKPSDNNINKANLERKNTQLTNITSNTFITDCSFKNLNVGNNEVNNTNNNNNINNTTSDREKTESLGSVVENSIIKKVNLLNYSDFIKKNCKKEVNTKDAHNTNTNINCKTNIDSELPYFITIQKNDILNILKTNTSEKQELQLKTKIKETVDLLTKLTFYYKTTLTFYKRRLESAAFSHNKQTFLSQSSTTLSYLNNNFNTSTNNNFSIVNTNSPNIINNENYNFPTYNLPPNKQVFSTPVSGHVSSNNVNNINNTNNINNINNYNNVNNNNNFSNMKVFNSLEKELSENQKETIIEKDNAYKYWLKYFSSFFQYVKYLLNNNTGIFFEYITNNGIFLNSNRASDNNSKNDNNNNKNDSKHNNHENNNATTNDSASYYNSFITNYSILNFSLLMELLDLQEKSFSMSKFNSIIINDSTNISYIRLHFTQFIKLYNKRIKMNLKLSEVNDNENADNNNNNTNINNTNVNSNIRNIIKQLNQDSLCLSIIVALSTMHIKCLANIALFRTKSIEKSFKNLGIAEFLFKEVNLEAEVYEQHFKYQENINKSGTILSRCVTKDKKEKNIKGNAISNNELKKEYKEKKDEDYNKNYNEIRRVSTRIADDKKNSNNTDNHCINNKDNDSYNEDEEFDDDDIDDLEDGFADVDYTLNLKEKKLEEELNKAGKLQFNLNFTGLGKNIKQSFNINNTNNTNIDSNIISDNHHATPITNNTNTSKINKITPMTKLNLITQNKNIKEDIKDKYTNNTRISVIEEKEEHSKISKLSKNSTMIMNNNNRDILSPNSNMLTNIDCNSSLNTIKNQNLNLDDKLYNNKLSSFNETMKENINIEQHKAIHSSSNNQRNAINNESKNIKESFSSDSLDDVILVDPEMMKRKQRVDYVPLIGIDSGVSKGGNEKKNIIVCDNQDIETKTNDIEEDNNNNGNIENDINNLSDSYNSNREGLIEVTLTNRTENLKDESEIDRELEELEDFDLVLPHEKMDKPSFSINLNTHSQNSNFSMNTFSKPPLVVPGFGKSSDSNNNNNSNNTLSFQVKETNILENKDIVNKTGLESAKMNNNNSNSNNNNNINNINKSNLPDNTASNNNNNSKIQLALERFIRKKYRLFYQKIKLSELSPKDLLSVNTFYNKERHSRLIYQDLDLHTNILHLILVLLINGKGTLNTNYCSSQPYLNNKTNILYILTQHLNHSENKMILPKLVNSVDSILPNGSGQRLLKLLITDFFDISQYSNWSFLSEGAYGTVYNAQHVSCDPKKVAIKRISQGSNILDKCTLFDIYNEITALQILSKENCATRMYDFGCDKESYYIVMAKYELSLKKWREKVNEEIEKSITMISDNSNSNKSIENSTKDIREKLFNKMLPIYLTIYFKILLQIEKIHTNMIINNDIKCDNVLIQYIKNPSIYSDSEILQKANINTTVNNNTNCNNYNNYNNITYLSELVNKIESNNNNNNSSSNLNGNKLSINNTKTNNNNLNLNFRSLFSNTSIPQITNNKPITTEIKNTDLNINNISSEYQNLLKNNKEIYYLNSLIKIKICDFGESWIFNSKENEYNMIPKGTDVCKSPEMLNNYYEQNEESDDEEILKEKIKKGTTRASDIWSLGCLFYELLTGKFLFEDEIVEDYFSFMHKINTCSMNDLINENKRDSLFGNFYLIDFLKFVLVKDANQRPDIKQVITRFNHVYAILVSENLSVNEFNGYSGVNIDLSKVVSGNINNFNQGVSNTANNLNINNMNSLNLVNIGSDVFSNASNFNSNIGSGINSKNEMNNEDNNNNCNNINNTNNINNNNKGSKRSTILKFGSGMISHLNANNTGKHSKNDSDCGGATSQFKHVYDSILKEVFIDNEVDFEDSNKHSVETSIELQLLKITNLVSNNSFNDYENDANTTSNNINNGVKNNNELLLSSSLFSNIEVEPSIMILTSDVILCDFTYLEKNPDKLLNLGITHIVTWVEIRNQLLKENCIITNLFSTELVDFTKSFKIYQKEKQFSYNNNNINKCNNSNTDSPNSYINPNTNNNNNNNTNNKNQINQEVFFSMLFKLTDIMRHVKLTSGKILLIDDHQYSSIFSLLLKIKTKIEKNKAKNEEISSYMNIFPKTSLINKTTISYLEVLPSDFMRTLITTTFSLLFNKSIYKTLSLLNKKTMFFKFNSSNLFTLSNFNRMFCKLRSLLKNLPVFKCLCGACVIVLKYNKIKRIEKSDVIGKKKSNTSEYLFEEEFDERRLVSCSCRYDSNSNFNNPNNNVNYSFNVNGMIGGYDNNRLDGGGNFKEFNLNSNNKGAGLNITNDNFNPNSINPSKDKKKKVSIFSTSPSRMLLNNNKNNEKKDLLNTNTNSYSFYNSISNCPFTDCALYIKLIKSTYDLDYKTLDWFSIQDSDLFTGFKQDSSTINNSFHKKLISLGDNLDNNLIIHSIKEKSIIDTNINNFQSFKYNHINNYSNYNNNLNSMVMTDYKYNNNNVEKEIFISYKCKICNTLMFAEKSNEFSSNNNSNNNNNNFIKTTSKSFYNDQINSDSGRKIYYLLLNNLVNNNNVNTEIDNIEFALKNLDLNELSLKDLYK